ncbi:MAG: ornithine carbamoyltransferase, partial [Anderseniella sp.]
MSDKAKSFLDISDLSSADLNAILSSALAAKRNRDGLPKGAIDGQRPLEGYVLAMIFEKPSTRTRVSFDMAIRQLGGQSIILSSADLQLGRGETIADTARVLSRMVDVIMLRTFGEEKLQELAAEATVPVINGLTDQSHPCQIMADLLTLQEHKGTLSGRKVAWVGDGNNVLTSWIHAAGKLDFELSVATPPELRPSDVALAWAKNNGARITLSTDPHEAVSGADCVMTDTWVSMNDGPETDRHNLLAAYQVNDKLMASAGSEAIFMHCLPAHRGEEVTASIIDGPRSVVFDEAENRLHAQKAILRWCLGKL